MKKFIKNIAVVATLMLTCLSHTMAMCDLDEDDEIMSFIGPIDVCNLDEIMPGIGPIDTVCNLDEIMPGIGPIETTTKSAPSYSRYDEIAILRFPMAESLCKLLRKEAEHFCAYGLNDWQQIRLSMGPFEGRNPNSYLSNSIDEDEDEYELPRELRYTSPKSPLEYSNKFFEIEQLRLIYKKLEQPFILLDDRSKSYTYESHEPTHYPTWRCFYFYANGTSTEKLREMADLLKYAGDAISPSLMPTKIAHKIPETVAECITRQMHCDRNTRREIRDDYYILSHCIKELATRMDKSSTSHEYARVVVPTIGFAGMYFLNEHYNILFLEKNEHNVEFSPSLLYDHISRLYDEINAFSQGIL